MLCAGLKKNDAFQIDSILKKKITSNQSNKKNKRETSYCK